MASDKDWISGGAKAVPRPALDPQPLTNTCTATQVYPGVLTGVPRCTQVYPGVPGRSRCSQVYPGKRHAQEIITMHFCIAPITTHIQYMYICIYTYIHTQ